MIRFVATLMIAACSLPLLAGCGTSSTLAPIPRSAKSATVKQAPAKPTVSQPTTQPNGSGRGFLTQVGAGAPSFSPKGDALVMQTAQGLAFSLPNGQQVRPVAGSRTDDQAPAWSPDGATIAFVRHNGTRSTALMRLNPATGQIDPIYETTEVIHSVAWAPDARALVYVAETGGKTTLYRLSVPGNQPVSLWKGTGANTVTVGATGMVVFDFQGDTGAHALARLPIAGGTPEKMAIEGTNPHHPRFSPTGRSLAYVADGGLYLANADGGGAARVASGDGLSAPAWNPKTTQIVVAAPRGGGSDLQAIQLPIR